jgi:hypothetical protein
MIAIILTPPPILSNNHHHNQDFVCGVFMAMVAAEEVITEKGCC